MKKIRIIDDKKQWLPIYCVANLFLIQYLESHSTWVRELKLFCLLILSMGRRRTPRECVSWNFSGQLSSGFSQVALHVSAWVEIERRCNCVWRVPCRTPRECVSWNLWIVLFQIYRLSRTPRECVSWNQQLIIRTLQERSHSTWVRELKFCNFQGIAENSRVALHVSAWVEIPEIYGDWSGCGRSHSTWVRELKFS